jgi:hypothetical protein
MMNYFYTFPIISIISLVILYIVFVDISSGRKEYRLIIAAILTPIMYVISEVFLMFTYEYNVPIHIITLGMVIAIPIFVKLSRNGSKILRYAGKSLYRITVALFMLILTFPLIKAIRYCWYIFWKGE